MPFQIVRNDITRMKTDAIVNAAGTTLRGGGGVDDAIRKAAGPGLAAACEALGGCPPGEARLTEGFELPARYVIHTVAPRFQSGDAGEEALLRRCYRESLRLAEEHGLESLAFPLLGGGSCGWPKEWALRLATEEIRAFLTASELSVALVVYGRESLGLGRELFTEVQEYIDDRYVALHPPLRENRFYGLSHDRPMSGATEPLHRPAAKARREEDLCLDAASFAPGDIPMILDESFQEMLLRKIDEKGMTDAQCYKRANIDRKHFSKIRSKPDYRPSKQTAVAFAVALELELDEARELLGKAGYAFSHSDRADLIVEYFISRRNYDIFQINEVLFYYDQKLLGV